MDCRVVKSAKSGFDIINEDGSLIANVVNDNYADWIADNLNEYWEDEDEDEDDEDEDEDDEPPAKKK